MVFIILISIILLQIGALVMGIAIGLDNTDPVRKYRQLDKKDEMLLATDETVEHFKTNINQKLIVLEHAMGDKFNTF